MTNTRGMTLIELLAAMTISMLMIGLVYSVFFLGMNSYDEQQSDTLLRQDAEYVMSMIANAYYDEKGELLPEIVNKTIYLEGNAISSPAFSYEGSEFITDDQKLTVTLVVSRINDQHDSYELQNTFVYPWQEGL